MSDQEIQVKITADVANMLRGMKEAKESVETAASGMKGDLGAMAESFEKLGTAALAVGAAGLAFEGLKEAASFVAEAVEKTKELSESFFTLGYATGASIEQMNKYTAAIELSGGTTENLQSLMVGMQRGIRANSDVLIENGVAANKAALDGLSFEDYLKRVHEIAEKMATSTEREQFLIMALGRGGAMAGAMLGEFVENMEKAKGTTIITDKSMAQLKETKESIGALKLAQQEYAASVSASATPIANFFRDLHTWYLQNLNDSNKRMEAYEKERSLISGPDAAREAQHAQGMSGSVEGPASQKLTTKADIEEAKAAAKEKERLAKEAAAEEKRWQHEISANAMAEYEWELQYKKKAAAAVVAEAKEEAREEIASAKDALTFKEELLNQDVAMGRITIAQKLAAEKDLVTQREMLEHQALAQEQLTEGISINKWQELENKKLDITRKADLERQKLQNQGELQDQQIWQGMLDKMTQGWDRGIQAMLHGQMTLSQGFTGALKQMENQTEMSFINMGLNWLKAAALQALIGKESHASQTLLDAKGAAAGAYNATVGIPFVGPVLAPAAAAVAFTGVMAFAEGGWDRVPSDQVAMIHKNEMVLPASIAEPVRQMAAAGAGGGGGQPLHIHAVDAPSVLALFRRHQGSLMSVMGEAMRNGRKS